MYFQKLLQEKYQNLPRGSFDIMNLKVLVISFLANQRFSNKFLKPKRAIINWIGSKKGKMI